MSNPSGSSLCRADHCPASCAYPKVETTSPQASAGSERHVFLAYLPKLGRKAALEQALEASRPACEAIDLEGLPLEAGAHRQEVAFAYDVATGKARKVGEMLGRNYGARQGEEELLGAIDVVTFDGDRPTKVTDYKFDGFESYAPPPVDNHQLKFAALCACRLASTTEIDAGLIHFRPDGSHWSEACHFGAFDLDVFADQLGSILRRVRFAEDQIAQGGTPSVSRGEWCRYCPALPHCPALVGLIRAITSEPTKTAEEISSLLSPETAARAYERLREVKEALKVASSALHMYASEHTIALPDGRQYGTVVEPRDDFDARKVRDVLSATFSPEVAVAACDFETSKAAIKRGLRPVYDSARARGEKLTLKSLEKSALEALDQAGAIRHLTTTKVKEHRVSATGELVETGSEV